MKYYPSKSKDEHSYKFKKTSDPAPGSYDIE